MTPNMTKATAIAKGGGVVVGMGEGTRYQCVRTAVQRQVVRIPVSLSLPLPPYARVREGAHA